MSAIADVIRSGIRGEDLSDLPPQIQRGLEPLLRFVNTGIQGLAQVLSKNVSLSDNMQTEVQTVNLDHGVEQLVSLKKLQKARGVRSLSVGSADGKIQHSLAQPLHLTGTTVTNQVKVLAMFQDTTAVRVPVTMELTPEGSYTSLTPSSGTWTLIGATNAPAFQNAWVAFGGAELTPGYLKDSLGFVHLRGTLTAGAINTAMFTLPSGYRPNAQAIYAVSSNNLYARLNVNADGTVVCVNGNNAYVAIDGITFDTRA